MPGRNNTDLERRKPKKIKQAVQDTGQKKKRTLTMEEIPETGEIEIKKEATADSPEIKIRFPKKTLEKYQMMPNDFANAQTAIEACERESREVSVDSASLESSLGYDSLMRVMGKYYNQRVAYYRSEEGGSLSFEDARKEVYRRGINEEETIDLFNRLMRMPTEQIYFGYLIQLNEGSPVLAQNIWEMIKREARREFESGHRAAEVFDSADYMTDCWNRASYIGLRESMIEEWQPKGGIELTMIDSAAQAWLQVQFWTKESVKRGKTEPRRENHQFYEWKRRNREANPNQWVDGHWDVPFVSEQQAVEHAAQMADRWQRMYLRAIRNLRDWRRYTPNLTINNAQQVNIASDGGQQINMNK